MDSGIANIVKKLAKGAIIQYKCAKENRKQMDALIKIMMDKKIRYKIYIPGGGIRVGLCNHDTLQKRLCRYKAIYGTVALDINFK